MLLTAENLEGITQCLQDIEQVYKKGSYSAASMEWPEKFPVVSNDGYSLGDIIFFEGKWVFSPAEC